MKKLKKPVLVVGALSLVLGISYLSLIKKDKVDMSVKTYGTYENRNTDDLTIHSFTTESEKLNRLINEHQKPSRFEEVSILDYETKIVQEHFLEIRFQEESSVDEVVNETTVYYNLQKDELASVDDFFNSKAIRYLTYLNRKETPMSANYNEYIVQTDIRNVPLAIDESSICLKEKEYILKDHPSYLLKGDSSSIPNISLSIPVHKKPIAFTFDDGPSDTNTRRAMDILEQYQGQGTFFVMGPRAANFPEIVKETLDRNHQIGSHTYNHKNLTKLKDDELKYEVFETERILQEITQTKDPVMVRPPYGAINDHVKEFTQRTFINWNIDSNDWSRQKPEQTCREIVTTAKTNGIILMHDLYDDTITALKCATKTLDAQGYQFVGVETLLLSQGIDIKPNKLYFNGNNNH